MTTNSTSAYRTAFTSAVVIRRSHEGRVRAIDRDRLDLLHRMSTNDLTQMEIGEARLTTLTTPIARMVDVLWVLNLGETALCLTSVGKATAVRKWLAGYIFYNDKVKFLDVSNELGQLGVYGARAADVVARIVPGAEALKENRFVEHAGVLALRGRPLAGDGYTLIAPAEQIDTLWEQALTFGATPADEDTYQLLRLAAGQPEGAHEISEDYLPLEANLWHAVSFSKGCYIGQEIIARMESRGKLARRLMGVVLAQPVAVGATVEANGHRLGTVTSAGVLPDLGPAALAYLKTNLAEAGGAVQVGDTTGVITELPLVK